MVLCVLWFFIGLILFWQAFPLKLCFLIFSFYGRLFFSSNNPYRMLLYLAISCFIFTVDFLSAYAFVLSIFGLVFSLTTYFWPFIFYQLMLSFYAKLRSSFLHQTASFQEIPLGLKSMKRS